MEGLAAPGIRAGRIVVDQRFAQLFLLRDDQLAERRLPVLVERGIEEVAAIELAAFGRPLRVGVASGFRVAQPAPRAGCLVELRDAQQLAAHRAAVAAPTGHDVDLLAHPRLPRWRRDTPLDRSAARSGQAKAHAG